MDAITRMGNISQGMTPTGQPVGGVPLKQFPQFRETAPPPVTAQQGLGPPPQGPPVQPAQTVGVTPGTTPEERQQGLIREAQKGGLTTKQYSDFVKTTPDYRGRLNMGFSEAVNHYSDMTQVDPEGAEEFKALWESQNKGKGLKLYAKPQKDTTTRGVKDVRSPIAEAIQDDMKLIQNNPRWAAWQNDPDSPQFKKVRWLQEFRVRVLRQKDTDKDWDIYTGEKPGPWEE
jgi:hypothetical protein